MRETSEQDFEESLDFFNFCSEQTGETINPYTLNKVFKSGFDVENNTELIIINDKFSMTFDSGGYTLIEK